MLELIPRIITQEQNREMGEIPKLEEVREVVLALNGDNTSGPDDF